MKLSQVIASLQELQSRTSDIDLETGLKAVSYCLVENETGAIERQIVISRKVNEYER